MTPTLVTSCNARPPTEAVLALGAARRENNHA
jgi:hypothetical protein